MEKQIAILIDGDNISAKYAEYIKQEALQYGNVKIFRLYGSINSQSVKAWYKVMPQQGIVPMLQMSYASGKSIADQVLTIDAMDLLYSNNVDVFCIVSSDSDFTKLVYRLKEAGKTVIGMGESKTKEALAKACDEFKILDLIYRDSNSADGEAVKEKSDTVHMNDINEDSVNAEKENEGNIEESEISIPLEAEIVRHVKDFIESSDDDKINLSEIGKSLKQRFLGFDARNYGYYNMAKMIQSHSDEFVVSREKAQDGIHSIIFVSRNVK